MIFMVSKKIQKEIITTDEKNAAEEEILKEQKTVDYDTKEYPVEIIVQKYTQDIKTDEN